MTEELPFCECGECRLRVTKLGNRFIHGHHRRGKHHTPETCTAISEGIRNSDAVKAKNDAQIGIPLPPEACAKMSVAHTGIPHTPEHCAATIRGQEEAGMYEVMRGGNDVVGHHYLYDHSDLSKNTVKMTRSDHTSLHNILRKLGYIVPHINVSDDQSKED